MALDISIICYQYLYLINICFCFLDICSISSKIDFTDLSIFALQKYTICTIENLRCKVKD